MKSNTGASNPLTTGQMRGQRILVVDDDPAVVHLVAHKLEAGGYEVLKAASGVDALAVIERQGLPHLAIIDINMPGMDGFELCRRLQEFSDVPVILLTAMDQEEIVIEGIESCAEDYVTKPFRPRELAARVGRVLRRMGDYHYTLDPVVDVDDRFSVDFVRRRIFIDGEAISLTPTETKLLYILMRNAGRTVTVDFLLHRIWPMKEVHEESLRVHIHRLRQKLEPRSASNPRYIGTARGVGYSFLVK